MLLAGDNKYYCDCSYDKHIGPHQHFTSIRSIVALAKTLAVPKLPPKHTGPSSITAPDVTSTLPHCETIQVKEGRGVCDTEEKGKMKCVFMVRNL